MSMLQSSASLPRLSRVERKTDDQAKMEVRFPLPALSAPSAAVAERRGQSGRTTSGSGGSGALAFRKCLAAGIAIATPRRTGPQHCRSSRRAVPNRAVKPFPVRLLDDLDGI